MTEEEVREIEDRVMQKVEAAYIDAQKDKDCHEKARECFLKLQQGDPKLMRLWRIVRIISIKRMIENYKMLNIKMSPGDIYAEVR